MGVAVFGRLRPYHFSCVPELPFPERNRFHRQALMGREFAVIAAGNVRGNIMARKNSVSDDIVNIERELGQLMADIETRVSRLNTLTKKSATHAANGASEFVSETISDATDRVRNGASAMTDEAARLGGDALRKIEDEVGQRPLLTLAIAAGIGFLAGMANRRH
jgi:ElaB/YqjD/DUF883 family membrane-anchored ribosome-binding protein